MTPLDREAREAAGVAAEYSKIALDHLSKLGTASADVLAVTLEQTAPGRRRRKATVAAAKNILADAVARRDPGLLRRGVSVARKMEAALLKGIPKVDRQLVGDVVADLEDLWEDGQRLDKETRRLFRMQFPRDREKLRRYLIGIQIRQLKMAVYYIRNLQKRVPKLLLALDRSRNRNSPTHNKSK